MWDFVLKWEESNAPVHAAQVEKAETEIKRLRGLNDMFEKDLEKLRGELESAHTRRKVCIVILLKIHTFTSYVCKRANVYFMRIIYCAWCVCKYTQSHTHAYSRVHAPTHTFTYTLAWQGRNQPTESEIGGDNRRGQWVIDRLPKGAACTQPTGRARKEHAIRNSGDRGTEARSWFSPLAVGGAQKAGEFRSIVKFYAHTNFLWRWCMFVAHVSNLYVFSLLTRSVWCNFKLFPSS